MKEQTAGCTVQRQGGTVVSRQCSYHRGLSEQWELLEVGGGYEPGLCRMPQLVRSRGQCQSRAPRIHNIKEKQQKHSFP